MFQYVTMAVVFVVVIIAGVVSKGATFFMVNQIAPKKIEICPENFPVMFDARFSWNVEPSQTERIGWLWVIFFSFLAPEIFTFFRNFRIFFMKHQSDYPQKREFALIFVFETLHVVGTSILFLIALPSLDSLTAILACSAVEFFPTALKPLNSIFGSEKSIVDLGKESFNLPVSLDE